MQIKIYIFRRAIFAGAEYFIPPHFECSKNILLSLLRMNDFYVSQRAARSGRKKRAISSATECLIAARAGVEQWTGEHRERI